MNKECDEIKIPRYIIKKIEKRIKETEFRSVNEYITFVLEEIIKDEDQGESEEIFSEKDEENVKERLKILGYLD